MLPVLVLSHWRFGEMVKMACSSSDSNDMEVSSGTSRIVAVASGCWVHGSGGSKAAAADSTVAKNPVTDSAFLVSMV